MADVLSGYELPNVFLRDDEGGGLPVLRANFSSQPSEVDEIVESFRSVMNFADGKARVSDQIVEAVSALAGFGPMLTALKDISADKF